MPDISSIGSPNIGGVQFKPFTKPDAVPATETVGNQFGSLLGNAIGTISEMQKAADAAAQAFAVGDNIDLHDVMIAQEQSSIAFQLGMQVRNKVVEAYQDVMRMQV